MYKIELVPDSVYPYHVYQDDERIDYFMTMRGAKNWIKRTKKREQKVKEYNEGQA